MLETRNHRGTTAAYVPPIYLEYKKIKNRKEFKKKKEGVSWREGMGREKGSRETEENAYLGFEYF